jgi:hypothetical protein
LDERFFGHAFFSQAFFSQAFFSQAFFGKGFPYCPRAMPERNVSRDVSSTRPSTASDCHPMHIPEGFCDLGAHNEQLNLKRA